MISFVLSGATNELCEKMVNERSEIKEINKVGEVKEREE